MKTDELVQATMPAGLDPLDHAALQRRGRRRRWLSRGAGSVAAVGLLAGILTVAVPPGPSSFEVAGANSEAASEARSREASNAPDPDVVADWEALSHGDAVRRLLDVLDATGDRPPDLRSIEVRGHPDGDQVATVEPGTGDPAIVDVSDEQFVVDGRFETAALIPAWTQPAARRALESLAATELFAYEGVVVDSIGRTVLEFEAGASDQRLWVDPGSGYVVGARYGGLTEESRDDERLGELTSQLGDDEPKR